jgi:outer membrane lipoprotein SlyB
MLSTVLRELDRLFCSLANTLKIFPRGDAICAYATCRVRVRHRTDPGFVADYPYSTLCQENNMKSTHTLAAIALATTALLTGCASTNDPYTNNNNGAYNNGAYNNPASQSQGYGTIDSIQVTRGQGQTTGSGAVIGGLIGAVVGNQVGSGSGRAVATVAGAVGGAAIGQNVEANRAAGDGRDMYQIGVRLDNGDYRTIVQDSVYDLRVGNRVRLVDGRAYRY